MRHKMELQGTPSVRKRLLTVVKDVLLTVLIVGLATVIGRAFSYWKFQETNVVVTYLLSVLLVARFTNGYFYGLLATVSSLILFNWYFTDPYFTLNVNDPTYTITFIIMTFTSVLTSMLTTKVKQEAIASQKREAENHALYQMTNLFTDAQDRETIAGISVQTVSHILSCAACIVCYDENGELENTFIQQTDGKQCRRELNNRKEMEKRIRNLHTPVDVDDEYYNYPIYGKTAVLAILRIPKEDAVGISREQSNMVHSIIESTALALDRLRSIQAQEKIRQEAAEEHYRGNLLRSISHDIRTPLSGIMGNVEMIMDMTDQSDPRFEIAKGVYQDADWLHSLVENILNLTKLHDGHMPLDKQPEAVEEVVAGAVMLIEKRFPERTVNVSMPDALIMAPMDAKLICQVLVNLLDNAVKHTPEENEISLTVGLLDTQVSFTVADRGSGIAESDLPHIFQMFYTTRKKSPDAQRGIGLGLAICQSIVESHGGQISACNREDGGAEFTFTLPTVQETEEESHETE